MVAEAGFISIHVPLAGNDAAEGGIDLTDVFQSTFPLRGTTMGIVAGS